MATTRKTAAASPAVKKPGAVKKPAARKEVSAKKETAEEPVERKPAKAPEEKNIQGEEASEKDVTKPESTRTRTSSWPFPLSESSSPLD